jgi:hypothetical protein
MYQLGLGVSSEVLWLPRQLSYTAVQMIIAIDLGSGQETE